MIARIDRWLAPVAPAERLALFRVLAGGFTLGYLLIRLPALWALTRRPDWRFDGVGILAWLDGPPARGVVAALLVVALGSGVAFTIGWRYRLFGPVFAATVLVITTFHSSWGQLLHFENLFTLHLLVLAFAPAADALAPGARPGSPSWRYGWPVRLAAIVTVATYFVAGVAKLRIGGGEWLLGDTLENHIAYNHTRLELLGGTSTPLAEVVVPVGWLLGPLAVAAVVIELAAPVALVGGRVRTLWVISAVAMHIGILALMTIFFPYAGLGFAFAPLFDLEHGWAWLRARFHRPAATPA